MVRPGEQAALERHADEHDGDDAGGHHEPYGGALDALTGRRSDRARTTEVAQPQRVRDDEHAGEAHRGGGDHRVQQPDGGERDRERVVAERPHEVRADGRQRAARQGDGVGGGARVAAHQRHLAGLDRDVGPRAHRDAEVGTGERRCVVDAVADHRDRVTLGLQLLDDGVLAVGQHAGDDPLDAELGGDGLRRALLVTGQQDGAQSERMERGDRLARRRLDRVGQRDDERDLRHRPARRRRR
jgi:hypothetical protein